MIKRLKKIRRSAHDAKLATKTDVQDLKNAFEGHRRETKMDMQDLRNTFEEHRKETKADMQEHRRATQADLQALEQRVNVQFGAIKRQFEYVHESIDKVLVVLTNIDKKLGGRLDDHERRITRLEDRLAVAA